MSSYSDPTHRLLEQIAIGVNRMADQQRVANLLRLAMDLPRDVTPPATVELRDGVDNLIDEIRVGLGLKPYEWPGDNRGLLLSWLLDHPPTSDDDKSWRASVAEQLDDGR